MSFASAFLDEHEDAPTEDKIAASVEVILRSISPECNIPASLRETRSSNLCFGVPMQWALGDGIDSKQVRSGLRERLNKFEPRLVSLQGIDITEDEENNSVTFHFTGVAQSAEGQESVEIGTCLSRLDQHVVGER